MVFVLNVTTGARGKTIPLETQILQFYTLKIYKQCTTLTAFGMNECGQKHTYYGIDLIGVLPWFRTEAQ